MLRAPKRLRRQMEHVKRCLVTNCDDRAIAMGLCGKHYGASWRGGHPHYDRNRWREQHGFMRPFFKKAEKETVTIASERRLLIRLKRKFGIPYRLPLHLQTMTPEQITRDWKTFI